MADHENTFEIGDKLFCKKCHESDYTFLQERRINGICTIKCNKCGFTVQGTKIKKLHKKFTYNKKSSGKFKIGDKVYCLLFGKGQVVNIYFGDDEKSKYPVHVKFKDYLSIKTFTEDGLFDCENENRSLYHKDEFIKIETNDNTIFKEFKIGDKVYCLLNGAGEVVSISDDENNLIGVKFNLFTGLKFYSPEGYYTAHPNVKKYTHKTLYHSNEHLKVLTAETD